MGSSVIDVYRVHPQPVTSESTLLFRENVAKIKRGHNETPTAAFGTLHPDTNICYHYITLQMHTPTAGCQ